MLATTASRSCAPSTTPFCTSTTSSARVRAVLQRRHGVSVACGPSPGTRPSPACRRSSRWAASCAGRSSRTSWASCGRWSPTCTSRCAAAAAPCGRGRTACRPGAAAGPGRRSVTSQSLVIGFLRPLADDHVSSVSQIGLRLAPLRSSTSAVEPDDLHALDGRPLNGCAAATSKRSFTPALRYSRAGRARRSWPCRHDDGGVAVGALDRGVGRVEQPRVAAHEGLPGPVDGEVGLVPHLPGAERPGPDVRMLAPQRAAGPVAGDERARRTPRSAPGRAAARTAARAATAAHDGVRRISASTSSRRAPRRAPCDRGSEKSNCPGDGSTRSQEMSMRSVVTPSRRMSADWASSGAAGESMRPLTMTPKKSRGTRADAAAGASRQATAAASRARRIAEASRTAAAAARQRLRSCRPPRRPHRAGRRDRGCRSARPGSARSPRGACPRAPSPGRRCGPIPRRATGRPAARPGARPARAGAAGRRCRPAAAGRARRPARRRAPGSRRARHAAG